MKRRFEKKVTTNGTITLRQRYLYRNYLQIASLDQQRAAQPALPSTPLQGYAVTGWYLTWDPTQPTATRPLALQQNSVWYTYKTAGGCKAGWTCVVRHAPVGRGAEGRLRVNWDLTKNICELYNNTGYILNLYSYTPYGLVTSNSEIDQPVQWSSEMHDIELGLVYYNYRYYNPTDGRWTRRDPIGIEGGINLYQYVFNLPLVRIDVRGTIAPIVITTEVLLELLIGVLLAYGISVSLRSSIQSSSFNSLSLSNIVSDVVDAIKTRAKNICNVRCKINYHAPHHHFTGLRLGLPFRVRCYARHIQLDCWIKKISGSNFLTVRVPFLPCYKYPGGKPADTWSRAIILP